MDTAEIVVRPLSPAGGAEIVGLDLREEVSETVRRQLREAWHKHALLIFHGQELDEERQKRVAEIFGELSLQGRNAPKGGGINYVSNVAQDGANPNGELTFHTDHSFFATPLRGLMLYAIEVPPEGGDTLFANAKLAYQLLPEPLRERIATLQALHVYDYGFSRERYGAQVREKDLTDDSSKAVHPVVLIHPETQEKILYVSYRHVDRILDLSPDESEALLEELQTYLYRPEIVYRHKWTPHDLAVWDNLALQHARSDFDPKYRRHLRRCQIA